jgi:hypothetical protein
MRGIIHSIILLVEDCLGSAAGIMVIFCMAHMDTPTRMGRMIGFGRARSRPRKVLLMGIASLTLGSQEYRCVERPTRLSGWDGRTRNMAW